jgi:FdhD protein
VPLIASQSCVTTRAVESAQAAGITLVGFAREGRLNVYAGLERVEFPRGD